MPSDTYTIEFGATPSKLLKPYSRKINWEGVNANYDTIAAELQSYYLSISGLSTRVAAVETPVFAATAFPFLTGTTFPITGASSGTPFGISVDFVSRLFIYNTDYDKIYFVSKVEEILNPVKALKLTISSRSGSADTEVASVTVTKTQTDAGTRDFSITDVNDSKVYGGLVVGNDFVTAIGAVTIANTTTYTYGQTQLNPSFVQVHRNEVEEAAIGSHVHREMVLPVGSQNGVNRAFTSPDGETWEEETLVVYLNGVPYNPTEIDNLTSTGFSLATTVGSDRLPNASVDREIRISYLVQVGTPITPAPSTQIKQAYTHIEELAAGASFDITHRADAPVYRHAESWVLRSGGNATGSARFDYDTNTSNEYTIEHPLGTAVDDGVIDSYGFHLYDESNDYQNPAAAVPVGSLSVGTWTDILGVTVGSTEPANTDVRWAARFALSGDFYTHTGSQWDTIDAADVVSNGMTTAELEALTTAEWKDINGFVPGTTDHLQLVPCLSSDDSTTIPYVQFVEVSNEFDGIWQKDLLVGSSGINISVISPTVTRFTNNSGSSEQVMGNVHVL